MTHDSLCPDSDPNRWVSKDFNGNSMSCRCEEYAKVREDEREKRTRYLLADDEGTWAQGYREGLVEGLQQRPTCQYDYDRGVAKGQRDEQAKRYEAQSENWEKGYAAALDASIAAVCEAIGEEWQGKIVPKGEYDCCGCNSYNGIVDDAVSAIEALKEKP